ncbi:MAG: gamma-glutamyl-gamma-aminobutyrate hydrolase family protein [Lawsonibacter sp.]
MANIACPRIQVSGSAGPLTNYCQAVRGAGGLPVAGYAPAPDLSCQGLLLCGGGDIAPARFGQESRGSQPPDPTRDQAELELFQAFARAGKPILGICRGIQLINVALGGTLLQDLPQEVRPFHSGPDSDLVHPIRALEGSLLHRLYGAVFPVNSAHHQVVDRLGAGLYATAWTESGVAEAIEHESLPILAVQFHPERMSFDHRRSDTVDGAPLLCAFLDLCRK